MSDTGISGTMNADGTTESSWRHCPIEYDYFVSAVEAYRPEWKPVAT